MNVTEKKSNQCKINLYGYLRIHAEERPSAPFLISDGETVNYGRALGIVRSVATDLISAGVRKGDKVAFRITRCADSVLISLALCAVGAVLVMCDAHFCVRDYIEKSGVDIIPDWYLTNEKNGLSIDLGGNWTLEGKDGASRLLNIYKNNNNFAILPDLSPDDPFMIIFTSGSTGASKAVVLSHKNVVANPVDAMPLFEENEKDTAVSLLPLNHAFGFAVAACAVFCGHGVVFPSSTDTKTVLSCIEKYGVSCIYSVPTFFLDLLADGLHKKYNISSLRFGLMAGGPFTEGQLRFIEGELGLKLMPGYGMSECVGISTMSYRDPVGLRAAGVGRPYPMTDVYILDDDGNETETGEICVRGMTRMLGYYTGGKISVELDEQGRLHTGDLGYFDKDGILHINGRKKDIIIRGGENISTIKIENALLEVGGVYRAAAVGVPDEKFGEVPCAAVVPARGAILTDEGIRAELSELVSKHEMPVKILILETLPLTSSGKTDKLKLKAMFV